MLSSGDIATKALVDESEEFAGEYVLFDDSGKIKLLNDPVVMHLFSDKVIYQFMNKINSTVSINMDDILVAEDCESAKRPYDLKIVTFGLKHSTLCGFQNDRLSKTITFNFLDESVCSNWANAINCMARGQRCKYDSTEVYISPPINKNYLILVNPISGSGNSMKIWRDEVEPVFKSSKICYKFIVTEYKNHAFDYMKSLDLSTTSSTDHEVVVIVVVGGDGLIFEALNGVASRPDRREILQRISFAPIPAGTGNGLAKSILFQHNLQFNVKNAIYIAIKGSASPLTLATVNTTSQYFSSQTSSSIIPSSIDGNPSPSLQSFLLLGWGLISDIDILSESLRWMGEARLHVAAVRFIMAKRLYHGRLSILPALQSPLIPISLPPLQEPLHSIQGYSDWKVIESQFVFVWILQTSHCTATVHSGRGKVLNDGLFMVNYVTDMSRFEMLQLLLSMDTGAYLDHPKVKSVSAIAYRLEPLTTEGIYTLDGEQVPYGSIQGVVVPSATNIQMVL